MSMCMYLKSGAMREVQRLARDPDALAGLAVSGHAAGGPATMGRAPAKAPPIPSAELERTIELMTEEARRRGWRHRILVYFLARRMRHQIAGMSTSSGRSFGGGDVLDLHKSWHVLHYAFTGSAEGGAAPQATLLAGGREVGEDLGYGPARLLDAATTQAFARFLDTVSPADLQSRLDVGRMSDLGVYGADDEDGLSEELEHYLPMLKDYIGSAARRGDGLVIWLM